jgi:alpha-beta hydrolase superfamily lysophospholipase
MTQATARAAHEEKIKSADGLNLFVRSWHPDGPARGVVALVPGFNSHSGYYSWAASRFTANGLAAYAVDLRAVADTRTASAFTCRSFPTT